MVCTYKTKRVVKIPSNVLGITYYVIVIGILGYIGGYGLAYSKGYQKVVQGESVVSIKVLGSIYTSFDDKELAVPNPELYKRFWDAEDVVTPAYGGESGGFVVLTNLAITANQTRGTCAEDPNLQAAVCKEDQDCKEGKSLMHGNGVMTGKCVQDERYNGPKTCQIHSWCPVGRDILPFGNKRALLNGTKDFTVLVKNTIEFPQFGPNYIRRNIKSDCTWEHLHNCIYNPKTDPHCPRFRIGDIVEGAGYKYEEVALTGAMFSLTITWTCSFDWGRTIDDCLPVYSFGRLDDPKSKVAPGWNYWSSIYHEENRRTRTHNYGIKFLIQVDTKGRKFDPLQFVVTVGASLGFLSSAELICDYILGLFFTLQLYLAAPWLAYFRKDMKYDLQFEREYERADSRADYTEI